MTVSSRRAEYVAALALILSVVFFGITFFVGRWSGYFALWAICWLIGSSILIWLVLWLQFHTRGLAEQEKLDTSLLARRSDGSTIFQTKDEQSEVFAVARRRLKVFEKWFLPVFSVIIAAYQITLGLVLLTVFSVESIYEAGQPLICAVCMTAVAFVAYLVSRYATGMSARQYWKPLRAGGSILLSIALLSFALAIGLALANFKIFFLVIAVSYITPVLQLVLGAETAVNVVLDIYRPRLEGQYSRSAFDSRLLGIINEPGGVFRSLAAAIDYQFGFKVSQTWFYQLLEKAIVPLVIFAAVVLYFLSCIVVVAPSEEAVIEHLGNPLDRTGQVRLAGPGLSFKLPWPFDIAYKYPTKKIMELSIGYVPKLDPKTGELVREPLLWGKTHYEEEYSVLLASEQAVESADEGAVPVSLLKANVPVQYRVKDLYSFIYHHSEPERLLESICYRELAKFCAGAMIEVDSEAELERSLLGAGRGRAKDVLTLQIQKAADQAGLGVEIVFVGLQGFHPPAEVAEAYQDVIGAVQKKRAAVLNAEAGSNYTLGVLAGSVEGAERLYDLAIEYQQAEQQKDALQIETLAASLDEAFERASGNIFKTLKDARSYAYEKAALARASGERFAGQHKAYKAAPQFYMRQQVFRVYEEALANARKFVVVADQNDTEVFIIDLQEKLTPSLYDITGFEESSEK